MKRARLPRLHCALLGLLPLLAARPAADPRDVKPSGQEKAGHQGRLGNSRRRKAAPRQRASVSPSVSTERDATVALAGLAASVATGE